MIDFKEFKELVLKYVEMGNQIAKMLQDFDLEQANEEYLSATEIEKQTNISSQRIRRWAREGKLLKTKTNGARLLYCLQEVVEVSKEK